MDIFKNSIFIDENIKQTLSSELTIYFEEVNKFIDSLAIKTNISLALWQEKSPV